MTTIKPDKSVFMSVATLPEVTAESAATLGSALQIITIADLAQSPHFRFADELVDAATDPRHPLRRFGIPGGRVTRAFEEKPLEELADAPLIALKGINEQRQQELTRTLGVKNIRQLALWPARAAIQRVVSVRHVGVSQEG